MLLNENVSYKSRREEGEGVVAYTGRSDLLDVVSLSLEESDELSDCSSVFDWGGKSKECKVSG